jgi:hypothetical protein
VQGLTPELGRVWYIVYFLEARPNDGHEAPGRDCGLILVSPFLAGSFRKNVKVV